MLAYIDPGSGSLILQMVVAGVVGGIAFFRRAIFGFLGFFKRKPPQGKRPDDDTPRE